jgi:hypothetical protein
VRQTTRGHGDLDLDGECIEAAQDE